MKKLLFVAILVVGFLSKSNAQEKVNSQSQSVIGLVYPEDENESKLHFGARVNFKMSALSESGFSPFGEDLGGDSGFKTKPNFGIDFGPIVSYDISKKWGAQAELLYSFEGSDFSNSDDLGYDDSDIGIRLQYAMIVLLTKYNFTERISLLAGPMFKFLTVAKEKFGDEDFDLKDDLNSFAFDALLMLQYNFIVKGKFRSSAGLRYTAGFSDINKNNDAQKLKSSSLGATLAFVW